MAMSACATGFCQLRGLRPPPDGVLRALAVEAFRHQVREMREISGMRGMREAGYRRKNSDSRLAPCPLSPVCARVVGELKCRDSLGTPNPWMDACRPCRCLGAPDS